MPAPECRLVDMHCHLNQMADADAVANDLLARGIAVLNAAVSPADAASASKLSAHPNVYQALGLHPWWIADGTVGADEAAQAAQACATSRLVGEVGLDFGGTRAASSALQQRVFADIVHVCAINPIPGRILSIHAVRSAGCALDILEKERMAGGSTCILHWFSGTSEELLRARKLGCFFSVGTRMLATKRGREYARQIPEDRLLLETDAPLHFGEHCSAAEIEQQLGDTLDALARLRGASKEKLARRIYATSEQLLLS